MGLDQWIKVTYDDKYYKKYYFRKNNVLRGYLIKYSTVTDNDNCIIRYIDLEIIKQLNEDCTKVLENNDLAEELLPIKEGFFFGTKEYDDWYYEDINTLKHITEEILNLPKIEDITYEDWW